MYKNIYLLCLTAPLSLIIVVAALMYDEPNEFARLGKLAVMGICPVVLALIAVSHVRTTPLQAEREFLEFKKSRPIHPLVLQLLLLLSIVLADWFYPFVLKEFGLKKYVYPSILTVLGIPIAAVAGAESGDAAEAFVFVLLPTFVIVHCISWFHVNLVRHRVHQIAAKRRAVAL
jgi:hypothetical protein